MQMVDYIVEWIVRTGLEETSNGSWIIYFEDITKQFPSVSEAWIQEHYEDISYRLSMCEEVAEISDERDCFNMMYVLNYCLDWDGSENWGCL